VRWTLAVADPDPRFALASERTLLAYQRTAIALVVAAVGAAHFLDDGALLMALCLLLSFASGLAAIGGHYRYVAVNRAIDRGEPINSSSVPILLTAALGLVVIVSTIMVIATAR